MNGRATATEIKSAIPGAIGAEADRIRGVNDRLEAARGKLVQATTDILGPPAESPEARPGDHPDPPAAGHLESLTNATAELINQTERLEIALGRL